MSAVSIDFPQMSLHIESDDIATFSGKEVDVEVLILQNLVDQAKSLLIKLKFSSNKASESNTLTV